MNQEEPIMGMKGHTKPCGVNVHATWANSQPMATPIKHIEEKIGWGSFENSATQLQQMHHHEIWNNEETQEGGREHYKEKVESGSQRGTSVMQNSNNAHHHHDSGHPPVELSRSFSVQSKLSVLSDKEEFKTPPASPSNFINSSTSLTRCSNCQYLEMEVKKTYEYILTLEDHVNKQTKRNLSALNEKEHELAVLKARLQELLHNENCLLEQLKINKDSERKRELILEHTKNKELQKLRKEKERAEKEKEWAENERDEAERERDAEKTQSLEKKLRELNIHGEIKIDKSLQSREIAEYWDQNGPIGCQSSGTPHSGHQHFQPIPGLPSTPPQNFSSPMPGISSTPPQNFLPMPRVYPDPHQNFQPAPCVDPTDYHSSKCSLSLPLTALPPNSFPNQQHHSTRLHTDQITPHTPHSVTQLHTPHIQHNTGLAQRPWTNY